MEKSGHNNETSWVEWWGELAEDMGAALAKGEDLTVSRQSIGILLGAIDKAAADPDYDDDALLSRLSREAWTGYGMHAMAAAANG